MSACGMGSNDCDVIGGPLFDLLPYVMKPPI